MTTTVLPERADLTVRRLRLGHLITAGAIDSTGLALGWTVFLLIVTAERGLGPASVLTSATLVGMALSAPLSAWASWRMSPRRLLQVLAVGEGACRIGIFVLLSAESRTLVMAPVVVLMSALAWSAYAAMRAEVSRAEATSNGTSLTRYAVAIATSEAIAAAGASLLITRPSAQLMLVVSGVYGLSLAPQWWVGSHAPRTRRQERGFALGLSTIFPACAAGGGVFLVAGGPALMATALSYERYGPLGVVASAGSFAIGSLGATRLQAYVARQSSTTASACLLGAVMLGSWATADRSIILLAAGQVCVGLTLCCLEGDLDARVMARIGELPLAASLATASACRALGGAVAVAALPTLLQHAPLMLLASAGAVVLLATAGTILLRRRFEGRPDHQRPLLLARSINDLPRQRPATGHRVDPAALRYSSIS